MLELNARTTNPMTATTRPGRRTGKYWVAFSGATEERKSHAILKNFQHNNIQFEFSQPYIFRYNAEFPLKPVRMNNFQTEEKRTENSFHMCITCTVQNQNRAFNSDVIPVREHTASEWQTHFRWNVSAWKTWTTYKRYEIPGPHAMNYRLVTHYVWMRAPSSGRLTH